MRIHPQDLKENRMKSPQAVYSGSELSALSAYDAVKLLKTKEVSPDELLTAAYRRMDLVEPFVNATVTRCEERARASLMDLPKRDAKFSSSPGWLAGLPIGIKDLTTVKGVRTTFGTKGYTDFVPENSDPMVEHLEQHGGIVFGKTNTPEMGAGGNTFNDIFGGTSNPWDTKLNAGGSSGGAAVSLATGEVWLSQGSDHGGSLRTPAAYCGIVGLRPSPGRVVGGSGEAGFFIEAVQGPMARSVLDCALFLDAMVGFNPRSPISYPAPDTPFQTAVTQANGALRIAFSIDLNGFSPVDSEMESHLRNALTLIEGGGAVVEETCPNLPSLDSTYHTLRGMTWATMARRLPDQISKHFKKTLTENIALGQSLTMNDIADANLNRTTIYMNMLNLFKDFDVFACPTVGCMPHPAEVEWVREVGGQKLNGYMDWLRFAFLATTAGLPSISVPIGLGPRGLPVGLQLIGPPRGEAKLLAAARAVEVAVGGPLGPIDPIVKRS